MSLKPKCCTVLVDNYVNRGYFPGITVLEIREFVAEDIHLLQSKEFGGFFPSMVKSKHLFDGIERRKVNLQNYQRYKVEALGYIFF